MEYDDNYLTPMNIMNISQKKQNQKINKKILRIHQSKQQMEQNILLYQEQFQKKQRQSIIKNRCLCIFELQTGFSIIFFFDVLIFIFLLSTSKIKYENNKTDFEFIQLKESSSNYLNILTDYIQITFLLIKIISGIYYLYCCYFPGRKDEEFILDDILGETQWKVHWLCRQRKSLQSYYITSHIYTSIAFIQNISMIWIFIDSIAIISKISCILVYTFISYFYIQDILRQLLDQLTFKIQDDFKTIHKKRSQLYVNQQNEIGQSYLNINQNYQNINQIQQKNDQNEINVYQNKIFVLGPDTPRSSDQDYQPLHIRASENLYTNQ